MASNPFDVPQQLRDTAEQSVKQAKEAFGKFVDASQQAAESTEGASRAVSEGASDLNRKTLEYMGDSVAATFDLAQRLVQARTVEEMTALQQEYFQRQAAAATQQGQEVTQAFSKIASEATEK